MLGFFNVVPFAVFCMKWTTFFRKCSPKVPFSRKWTTFIGNRAYFNMRARAQTGVKIIFDNPIDKVGFTDYDMQKSSERGGRKLCTTVSFISRN